MGKSKKVAQTQSFSRAPNANCDFLHGFGLPEEIVLLIGTMKQDLEYQDYQEYVRNMMIARLLQGGKYKKARNHRLKKDTVDKNDKLIKEFLDNHKDVNKFWQDFCLHVHQNQAYIWAKFDKTGWWCKNHYSFETRNSIPSSADLLFMYQYYYNLYYDDRKYDLNCEFQELISNSTI